MKIIVEHHNETYIKVICESGITQELSDYFTFYVPGYKFMPAYKNKLWDGKIRLFNTFNKLLYAGLSDYVKKFCEEREYEFENKIQPIGHDLPEEEYHKFLKKLNLSFSPRDYQTEAFFTSVKAGRKLLLSPTASGKSFIIYLLVRYYNVRTLIIVPTISLVSQLASDFADYGFASDQFIHRIYSGQDKETNKQIVISTWQSIFRLPKSYFESFDLIIGDEAHLFKAKSLTTIMEKLSDCKYRFGFTGTLDGTLTHKLVLEGLFGPVNNVTSTDELIKQKYLSKLEIKALVLGYSDTTRKLVVKSNYQDEMDFISRCSIRNNFIKNLTINLQGNTLLLFQYVDKHGVVLYDMIKKEAKDRKVFFVSGSVKGEDRESIRKIVEQHKDERIVLEFGDIKIICKEDDDILLSNGKTKKAKNISENDDISDDWIMNNQ